MTPELFVLLVLAVLVAVPLAVCWLIVVPVLAWDEWVAWSETNPTHPLAHRSAVMYRDRQTERAPRRSATRTA